MKKIIEKKIQKLDVHSHSGTRTNEPLQSKMISNDQELIQSDPTSCPQNQKGNN